jgi:ubiquinone/menaquinone biosynthesis C-methylase UbiE
MSYPIKKASVLLIEDCDFDTYPSGGVAQSYKMLRRKEMGETRSLDDVRNFWSIEVCGTHFIKEFKDKRDFFEKYRDFRYKYEWHIPLLVPFAEAKGKSVLEIGTGNGVDGAMFAKNGANYTGVDLTQVAINATREHFEILGLKGTFQVEDARQLSFDNNTFDVVYSHGVLHHSPETAKAIKEVYRVLKPGGKAIIMLYHKHSFNYYIRIMGYMRLRVIMKILSRLGHYKSDKEKIPGKTNLGQRCGGDIGVWDIRYNQFLKEGWRYLQASNFVHHCTDGPECPYAFVFTKSDVGQMFSMFRDVEVKIAHFPLRKYRFGQWVPLVIEKFIASKIGIGWHLFVFATK